MINAVISTLTVPQKRKSRECLVVMESPRVGCPGGDVVPTPQHAVVPAPLVGCPGDASFSRFSALLAEFVAVSQAQH